MATSTWANAAQREAMMNMTRLAAPRRGLGSATSLVRVKPAP